MSRGAEGSFPVDDPAHVFDSRGLLTWCIPGALIGSAEQSRVLQARQLEDQGQFAEAVRILEPMVKSEADTIEDPERGIAFNLLGLPTKVKFPAPSLVEFRRTSVLITGP